jgi:release factor glutamine methyltransferase
MLTVLEVIKKTTEFFGAKGIESPRLNAELLVGSALGLKRMQLYMQFERPLSEAELEKVRPLVRRRGQREPLQYILGETDFCGLRLKTDRRALIPRPETELLVEIVVAACAVPPARILDLGTGSGAIALALAKAFPTAEVLGVDRSPEALALARENAAAAGLARPVTLAESDWFSAVASGPFDLIVANPPYLSAEETAQTAAEVHQFEPVSALTAADEGRADLLAIIRTAPGFLSPGGLLAVETGISQHAILRSAAEVAGLVDFVSRQDLTGRDRYVLARRPGGATPPPSI